MTAQIVAHLTGIDVNLGRLIRAVGAYGLVQEADSHPFQSPRASDHTPAVERHCRADDSRGVSSTRSATARFQHRKPCSRRRLRNCGRWGLSFAKDRSTEGSRDEDDRRRRARSQDASKASKTPRSSRGSRRSAAIGRWDRRDDAHVPARSSGYPARRRFRRPGPDFSSLTGCARCRRRKVLAIYGERWGPPPNGGGLVSVGGLSR